MIIRKRMNPLHILILVAFAIVIRLPNINAPISDVHAWRQSLTATVARNFVLEDANILHPRQSEILPENNRGRYVFLELPVYQYAASLLYRLFGFHDWVPRAVTVASAAVASVYIYAIGLAVFGSATVALISALVFNVFPVAYFYGRAVLPDMTMVALLSGGLYWLFAYIGSKRSSDLLIASAFLGASVSIKPYSLIYAPLWVYALIRENVRGSIRTLVTMGVATMSIIVLPYAAWAAYFLTRFPDAIPADHMNGMVGWMRTTVPQFVLRMGTNFGYELFTAPLSVLAGIGIILVLRNVLYDKTHRVALLLWLVMAITYLLIVASGNVHHHYYQLPLAPLAAILIGITADSLVRSLARTHSPLTQHAAAIAVGIAAVVFGIQFTTIVRGYEQNSLSYYGEIPNAQRIIPTGVLVIVSGSYREPTFLDLSWRRGWVFNSEILEGSVLPQEYRPETMRDEDARLMPVAAYTHYLIPYVQRKVSLGARYLILLRREMPTSYVWTVDAARQSFTELYTSEEMAIFSL